MKRKPQCGCAAYPILDCKLHYGSGKRWPRTGTKTKGENMKKLLALVSLALCMSASSFGADVVGHSAKVAGKDTYKAAKVSAKDTGKATKAFVKFIL
jgi:hypothetical protein